MRERLLICTDLDRTLMPNGAQPESPGARERFARLVDRPEVRLAYVTGRDRKLVEDAIGEYSLPVPDFAIADVGTTIYRVGAAHAWQRDAAWEQEILHDWAGRLHDELAQALSDLPDLRLQEASKQNTCKLSYYLPLEIDTAVLSREIEARLRALGVRPRLIWSLDEVAATGLLDVLPARASKLHAIEALMRELEFDSAQTVFCGDSGNDLEVLASEIPAVLVANATTEVRTEVVRLARETGHEDRLYLACGNFHGMNGNYAAGMLEGIEYYHPGSSAWMGFADDEGNA